MMLPTKYANRREKILEQENPLVSFVCSVGGSVFLPVDEPASPMPATACLLQHPIRVIRCLPRRSPAAAGLRRVIRGSPTFTSCTPGLPARPAAGAALPLLPRSGSAAILQA